MATINRIGLKSPAKAESKKVAKLKIAHLPVAPLLRQCHYICHSSGGRIAIRTIEAYCGFRVVGRGRSVLFPSLGMTGAAPHFLSMTPAFHAVDAGPGASGKSI